MKNIISIFILMATSVISLTRYISVLQSCCFIMVYLKVTSDVIISRFFPKCEKSLVSNWLLYTRNPRAQSWKTCPCCLQPSIRLLMSPLNKTFKRGKIQLHSSECTCQQLKQHAAVQKKGIFTEAYPLLCEGFLSCKLWVYIKKRCVTIIDWFWVIEDWHCGQLSAGPWSWLLRPLLGCKLSET